MIQQHNPIYTIDDAITRLEEKLDDIPALAERYKQHRFDEYYKLLVDETTSDILSVAVDRLCIGLPPIGDGSDLDSIDQVADLLAAMFDKDRQQVTDDLVESIREDADYDLRMARLHRATGKLH